MVGQDGRQPADDRVAVEGLQSEERGHQQPEAGAPGAPGRDLAAVRTPCPGPPGPRPQPPHHQGEHSGHGPDRQPRRSLPHQVGDGYGRGRGDGRAERHRGGVDPGQQRDTGGEVRLDHRGQQDVAQGQPRRTQQRAYQQRPGPRHRAHGEPRGQRRQRQQDGTLGAHAPGQHGAGRTDRREAQRRKRRDQGRDERPEPQLGPELLQQRGRAADAQPQIEGDQDDADGGQPGRGGTGHRPGGGRTRGGRPRGGRTWGGRTWGGFRGAASEWHDGNIKRLTFNVQPLKVRLPPYPLIRPDPLSRPGRTLRGSPLRPPLGAGRRRHPATA